MGHPPRLLRAILIFGFVLLSLISVSAKKCNLGCHGGEYAKAYQEGHTYVYRLEGTSVTSVTDAKEDTTLNLKAIVELTAKPDCVLQLKLKDVNLNDAAASLPDLQKYALQFSYHNGHIDSDVCAEPDDSQTSLNIKRAVVSLFQSAVQLDSGSTVHLETDVFGSCSTDFSFQKEGDSLLVQKYKDLSQCSYREKIGQGLVTSVFDKSSGVKSTPLLVSQQKIEQRFKQGILNKASSTETYKFQPFSNGDAGAKTEVETILIFKGEKADDPSAPVSVPKSIIFETPHPVVKSSADAINNALKVVSKEKRDFVNGKVAEKFAELVKILRVSSKKDILSIYHKVTAGAGFNKVTDKKILLDALFRTGSGEAAEVAVELVKNRELTNLQTHVFYASLSLIRHVNLPAVTAVASLLDQNDLPRIGFLGIGQTIGKYCKEHPCDNVPAVKDAIHKIHEKVGNGKTKSRTQENQIISGLKALGNSKYLDDTTLQKLSNIAVDKQVSNRVRVAAIETLSTTCSMKWKNPVMNVLNDYEEDSEIRIKVYLALVNCACPHVANKIEEILNKETVNQVGSFITSHLRNLRASTDPNKKAAQKFLGHIKPRTKFSEDFRKFSFNNELSYNLEAFGIGSSVESNVIYSQNSFIPRSTNLNLTVEIFGQSFDFLELNTRVENLDRLIEHYFGPKGQFSKHFVDAKTTNEATENADEIKKYIYQRFEQLKRNKRDVKQGELDKFAKNVHLRNTEVDEDLNVDLSLKLFGVELAFLSYQDNPQKFTLKNLIDKIFDNFKTGFDLIKDFDYNFQNHLHFLDAELIYPTGLGIPLSLGVTGTSVVNIKTKGKFDIASILKDPNNAAVQIALEPSASIRITGSMMLEALDRNSGVVITGTLVTDTASDVSIKIIDGTGFDVNFGIPNKKQHLISVSSEILFTSGPKGEQLVPFKFEKDRAYTDCFEQLSTLLGLTVCGHIQFPYNDIESKNKPYYPLSGPSKFGLTIENNDVKNYYFKIYYNKKVPNTRGFEILFETPNSKIDRRMSLLVESGLEPDKYFKVDLNLPIKKASLLAIVKNKPEEKTLSLTVHHDINEYFLRTGIIANGNKYKPILEYKVPEHIEKLSGTKIIIKGEHGDQLYKIDGIVNVNEYEDGKKYIFENIGFISANRKILSLDGYAISTTNKATVDVKLNYGDEHLALKLDGNKLGESNYVVELSAVPSKDPNVAFNAKWEYNRQPRKLDHKFVFIHGADLNSQTNRFTLEQHFDYNLHSVDLLLSGSQKLTYPAMNALLETKAKITNSLIKGNFDVKYEKFKFGTELSLETDMVKPGDYEFELEIELMQNKIELKSKRTVIEIRRKYKLENSLELSPGGKYEANGEITYEINKNLFILQLNGDLNLNGKVVTTDTALEIKSNDFNSHAVISIGANKYLDFSLKSHNGLNPNGNLNLNLKNYLIVVGQYNYKNGKGNGHITIDVPKYNRKIKTHGDLTISGSLHTVNFELLYDADKDPNKRIKLSSASDITKTSVDTKNIIEILSYKLELNVKGDLKGTLYDGELTINADTTLPSGRYIVLSGKRVSIKKGNEYDINVQSELINYVQKGGASQKFIYNADVKDLNMDKITFKGHVHSNYVGFDGRDLVSNLVLNHLENTENRNIELDLKQSGSLLYKPFAFGINSDCGKNNAAYKIKSSFGDDFDLTIDGNYIGGNYVDTPFKHVFNGEMKLPFEKLQNIKLHLSGNVLLNQNSKLLEYSGVQELTYNSNKNIKMDINMKYKGDSNSNEGSGKISLTVLQYPPLLIENSFNNVVSDNIKKFLYSIKSNYGDKGGTLSLNSAYVADLSMVDINAKATTTMDKLKNIDFRLNHQKKPGKEYRQTDVTLQLDDSKYTLNTEVQEIKTAPLIHITYTDPSGVTELLSKLQKLGDSDYTGEWKIQTPKGFITSDARVNLESIDNFLININVDSDKLKQRKIHAEIANKPTAKTGRRIIITVTSDGKNLVTGSTNYKKREEGNKIIVEGNGSLKIGENIRSSSFKYTRQQLTHETDGEAGVAIVLNANFGPSAIVQEIKLTNKELHVFISYCEENKDCAHFKLQTTVDTDKKSYLKQQQTVEFDLKKFNIPAEFGLQINTQYANDMFDHTANLYMHSSKGKSQYTYQLYIHPKEAAAILTLPSRELALIGTLDLPKHKPFGLYKLTLSSFLDRKNKPSEKTSLSINSDVNLVDKSNLSVNGEAKFTSPQAKEMVVKGKLYSNAQNLLDANVDIDVFAKKSQKINLVAKIVRLPIQKGYNITGLFELFSKNQQIKIEHKVHLTLSTNEIGAGSVLSYTDINLKPRSTVQLFSANQNEAHLLITLPGKEIIRYDVKMEFSKALQKVEIDFNILDRKPIFTSIEINDFNNFKYVQYEKDNPNNKLTAGGHVVLGELAEVHSNFYKNGEKKNLFHILVHLDENKFLKPDFGYNKDNIEYLSDYRKNQILDIVKEMKKVIADTDKEIVRELKDLLEQLKKSQPNLKPLLDYYSSELNKFKNELNADETIQEIQANLNKHFGSFINAANEIIKKFIEQLNELSKQCNLVFSKLSEAIEATYPRIKESCNKILNAFTEILDATAKLATTYLKAILNVINDHQKEIKELFIMGTELFQGVAKILFKAAEQLRKDINEFVTLLINQAKALPIYEIAKEKYNQIINFEAPETLTIPIVEACNVIKAGLSTKELKHFFNSICDYVMMIIKRKNTDNINQVNKIYTEGIAALKSLTGLIEIPSFYYNLKNILNTNILINLGSLTKLPGIATLKLSVLNVLQSGDLPSPLDIYYTYKPTLHLNDIVPPFSKTGTVVDGGHVFTFDGNHLTLPGTCNYILAQDMQDGNFSVIANFQNGILVSLTLTEPKESITLKNNGNILVNNKPADYPASTKNLHAFLTKPVINVKSNYGVRVICNGKAPMICTVRVSGFYLGKLRGLLGDGNNEPYDDYTLPSGKITQDGSEFGNAYKLKGDCPAVTAAKPSAPTPTCTEYFTSSSSPLSTCFKYVDPKNYQVACDQIVNAGTSKDGRCLIALAYYAACYERNVFGIRFPDSCVSCKAGANSLTVGENFSIKLPKKEADIIFIVEETVQNEKIFKDLIVPLMSELREELKQHSITDVHIGLVGFGEHLNWPHHYTTNGNTNIVGEVKNIKFDGENPIISLSEAIRGNTTKKLKYLEQRYDVEFGTFKLTEAYEQAINYQFRPEAAKAVIGVITSPCEKSPLPISLQQLRLLLGQKVYRDLGLEYYHVSFLNDILISGKPQKNVVGYDYDSAYIFSDSKKRPMEGSNDLKHNLALSTSDVCADFAVYSGGAAFSSNNFLDAKSNQKKQFIQVVARRITNGLVNTEIEEDCVCKQSYEVYARLSCKVVSKREKEPLTRHTKGGVKG